MKAVYEEGTLTLFPTGKIDSFNADETERQIKDVRGQYDAAQRVVLDFKEVNYISSAGLRIVLRLRKAEKELRIINVQAAVYEVFDMTGFTEMMDIQKAFREISVEGCEAIGSGACGTVYRLTPETIVKVYRKDIGPDDILRERRLAKKAFVLGIPTAISFEIVRVGDCLGSVFELLNARSMAQLLREHPEKMNEYAAQYIDLLKKIHSVTISDDEVPDKKAENKERVPLAQAVLPAETAQKLGKLFDEVPDSTHLLHGDYHIKNIMMQNDEIMLIDMDTLCVGDPVFEFSSMYSAYVGYGETDHAVVENFLGISYDLAGRFWRTCLQLYLGTDDADRISAFERKVRIFSYMRMISRLVLRNGQFKAEFGHYVHELTQLL